MRVWGSRSQTGDKTVGAGRRDTGSVPSVTPSFQSQEHLALGDAIACESGLPDSLFLEITEGSTCRNIIGVCTIRGGEDGGNSAGRERIVE